MDGLIDVHCHILPGIDDGPKTLEQSADIIKGLREIGFLNFIATPHVRPPRWDQDKKHLEELKDSVLERVGDNDIRIYTAAENFFDDQVWQRLEDGTLLKYPNGTSALFEFSTTVNELPFGFERKFFNMIVGRTTPVLAHPERSPKLCGDMTLVERLVNGGTILCPSLISLGGRDGWGIRRNIVQLIRKDFVQMVATDIHDVRDLPYVRKGIKRLRKLVGDEGLEEMLVTSPRSLIKRG